MWRWLYPGTDLDSKSDTDVEQNTISTSTDTGTGSCPSRDIGTDVGDGTDTRTEPEDPRSELNFGAWLPRLTAVSIENNTGTVTDADTRNDANADPDTCVDTGTDSVNYNVEYPTDNDHIKA